jgi:hypothetical protein
MDSHYYVSSEHCLSELSFPRNADDLAVSAREIIMSCKGQSVVAARRFVDEVCALGRGVPLLTAHEEGHEPRDSVQYLWLDRAHVEPSRWRGRRLGVRTVGQEFTDHR